MAQPSFRLPSGSGGIVRFSEEYKSKLAMRPEHVIVAALVVTGFVLALHLMGVTG